VELIVQPTDGAQPIISAVQRAQKTIDLIIFRFDLRALEKAIDAAVKRGVSVRTLIAHTNSGGEKRLRLLETRMLDAGVMVSRTADDLVRYHGKLLIVDREELHVYGFNYTSLDIKSRSFGLICRDRRAVQDALRLFESDAQRQTFEPTCESLVVSPENARKQLMTFIRDARKQLMIWDPKVTDPQMIREIQQRIKAGVDVRVIGKVARRGVGIRAEKSPMRLHLRAMVRDGDTAFVGSQSLRALELDGRREVGLIARDPRVVKRIAEVFESDWARTDLGRKELKVGAKVEKEQALTAP
jgi:cardiolipin synthase A/B